MDLAKTMNNLIKKKKKNQSKKHTHTHNAQSAIVDESKHIHNRKVMELK